MDKTGFIGFGQMGGTMLQALLRFGALSAEQVIVTTRTEAKLKSFRMAYPGVEVVNSPGALAQKCQRVFICTGTREVKDVLTEVAINGTDLHIITITAGIEMRSLEKIFKGRITKIMPSLLIELAEGIILVQHNRQASSEDRRWIEEAFSKVGRVRETDEAQLDLAADLTSCAPAFWAAVVRDLQKAALIHSDLTAEELKGLILPTLLGSVKMMIEKEPDLEKFINRVATRGGITEEGIKVLDRELPPAFDKLLAVTLQQRQIIKQQTRAQFGV